MLRTDLLEEDSRRALRDLAVEGLEGKTALITGASGVIGTHFLYGLKHCQAERGCPIRVVALVQREVPPYLAELEKQGYVRFLRGDLSDSRFLESLPRADIIVHAATYAQPALFTANPETTLKLGTTTTFALLERLLPRGRFLFVSSSELYSGLETPPFRETEIGTTTTIHPRSCYIEAKRCGEAICHAHSLRGVSAKAARLSLAYGPGARPGDKRVLDSFVERGLREGVLRLMDHGEARRTYCYIADAMYMMWRILLEGREFVYNVAGRSRTTIADVARLVGTLLDVPVEFPSTSAGASGGAPVDVWLDTSRFCGEFGEVDHLPFEEGLRRTVAWHRGFLDE